LRGEPFPKLKELHFEDVTGGRMPGVRQTSELRMLTLSEPVVRQEVARHLDGVQLDDDKHAKLVTLLQNEFGRDFLAGRSSVTRIAFNVSRRHDGWSRFRGLVEGHREIFPPDDKAVIELVGLLNETC
jgi:hypothetical protein